MSLDQNADSLINLLTAQCADLEKFLLLAREATRLAGEGDFEKTLQLMETRLNLSARLEISHRQIAELRESIGGAKNSGGQNSLLLKTTALVNEIMQYDAKTKSILLAVRADKFTAIENLIRRRQCSGAYSGDAAKGLVYDLVI